MNSAIRLTSSFFIIIAFISYWISSISTVFLNKFFLSKSSFNFSIILVQNTVSAVLAYVWVKGFGNNKQRISDVLNHVPTRNLLIFMTFTYITTLTLNNICLRLVTVSFFQVARSLNLISTVIFTYALLGQKQSHESLFCCVFVVGGFWLTTDQESGLGTLDFYGVLFGLSASVSLGVQVVLIKKALDAFAKFSNPDALLCLLTNSLSVPLLLILTLVSGEFNSIKAQYYNVSEMSTNFAHFWFSICFSGALTFAIALSSNACIRLTSPLSHNISVQTKSVVQTIFACWFYAESKTWLWWIGNSSVVLGAAAYTYVKLFEAHLQKAKLALPLVSPSKSFNGNGIVHKL